MQPVMVAIHCSRLWLSPSYIFHTNGFLIFCLWHVVGGKDCQFVMLQLYYAVQCLLYSFYCLSQVYPFGCVHWTSDTWYHPIFTPGSHFLQAFILPRTARHKVGAVTFDDFQLFCTQVRDGKVSDSLAG
jgi:hypothetical protein